MAGCIFVIIRFHTLALSTSLWLAELQSTTRISIQAYTEGFHLPNMALPKRIIKETERLMAEPYVYPYQTIIPTS
jgi:hypothetical protein